MEAPETSGKTHSKTRPKHLWKKGESGNLRGNHRGSKHRVTLLVEAMYAGEAEAVTRKVIELAKQGDLTALKICADRLCAPVKSRPIQFKLPALRTVSDALAAMTLIIDGAARGEILSDEATTLTDMVTGFVEALKINDLETRLGELEKWRDEGRAATQGNRFDA